MAAVPDLAPTGHTAVVRSTDRRNRRVRMMTLMAVAVGVLAGAWVCASGMVGGQPHHTGGTTAIAETVDHSSHDRGPGPSHTESSSPDDVDGMPTASHPGMVCVTGVDLRTRDLTFATVCDDVTSASPPRHADHPSEPEPPVPRLS